MGRRLVLSLTETGLNDMKDTKKAIPQVWNGFCIAIGTEPMSRTSYRSWGLTVLRRFDSVRVQAASRIA